MPGQVGIIFWFITLTYGIPSIMIIHRQWHIRVNFFHIRGRVVRPKASCFPPILLDLLLQTQMSTFDRRHILYWLKLVYWKILELLKKLKVYLRLVFFFQSLTSTHYTGRSCRDPCQLYYPSQPAYLLFRKNKLLSPGAYWLKDSLLAPFLERYVFFVLLKDFSLRSANRWAKASFCDF